MVAVPGMVRLAGLVLSGRTLLAQQAVMLNVIGRGELEVGPERGHQQIRQHAQTQPQQQGGPQHHGHQRGLQDFVVQRPDRFAFAPQTPAFQRPGPQPGTGHFAQHEAVNRFAHARGSRVVGRGHVAVVAAVVLDEEVAVEGGRQHDLGQPALKPGVLVAHLVAQVDAKAAGAPGNQHHGQQPVQRQVVARHEPGAKHKRQPEYGHQQVGYPAVVAVGLQRGHGAFRRVAAVLAQQQVNQRDEQVEEHHLNPQHARVAGAQHQHRPQQHAAGHQQRHHPDITFGVAVGRCGGSVHGRNLAVSQRHVSLFEWDRADVPHRNDHAGADLLPTVCAGGGQCDDPGRRLTGSAAHARNSAHHGARRQGDVKSPAWCSSPGCW